MDKVVFFTFENDDHETIYVDKADSERFIKADGKECYATTQGPQTIDDQCEIKIDKKFPEEKENFMFTIKEMPVYVCIVNHYNDTMYMIDDIKTDIEKLIEICSSNQ